MRRRKGNWEAKVRQDGVGTYSNSQFEERSGPADIALTIRKFIKSTNAQEGQASEECDDFRFEQIARYSTVREAWKVDSRFEVVFDTTDFDHAVGEGGITGDVRN